MHSVPVGCRHVYVSVVWPHTMVFCRTTSAVLGTKVTRPRNSRGSRLQGWHFIFVGVGRCLMKHGLFVMLGQCHREPGENSWHRTGVWHWASYELFEATNDVFLSSGRSGLKLHFNLSKTGSWFLVIVSTLESGGTWRLWWDAVDAYTRLTLGGIFEFLWCLVHLLVQSSSLVLFPYL